MTVPTPSAKQWLRAEIRQGRRAALPAVLLGLAGTVLAVVQVGAIAAILGGALGSQRPAPGWAVGAFIAAALLRAAAAIGSERLAVRAGTWARQRLRTDVMARLLAAGPAMLRRDHSAALAATVVDRIDALDGFYARWIPAAFLAIGGPLLVLVAVAFADWPAALVLGGAGLLVPVAQAVSGIGAAAASRRQLTAMARLQTRFLDRIRGIATIVLAGRATDEAAALAKAADELRRRTMRVLRVAFIASAALDCAAALALVTLALRYGAAAMAHGQDPATALFVLLLVPEFFAPLRAFSVAYQDRSHAAGAAEALTTIPPLPAPASGAQPVRTVSALGVTIAFEHVGFSWDTARGTALDDVSFRVPAGETLLLTGPSGSGKSTVIELLLGFVQAQSGRVLVNGADISAVVPQALTRMTAAIGQRPMLFAGTVRDNIRFARPDASEREIESAVRSAGVATFTDDLPQGLDTPIGEGGYGLSGGQAQRVAIARAFLKNAPLLLLDEPTAHLDPATERDVLDSLHRLSVGRTVILASHSSLAHRFGARRLDLRGGKVVAARGAA